MLHSYLNPVPMGDSQVAVAGAVFGRRLGSVPVGCTPGTYGTASVIAQVTVNSLGQVTLIANQTIALNSGAISDFVEAAQDSVGAMIDTTLEYVDGTPLLRRAALTGDVTAPAGSNVTTLAKSLDWAQTIDTLVGDRTVESGCTVIVTGFLVIGSVWQVTIVSDGQLIIDPRPDTAEMLVNSRPGYDFVCPDNYVIRASGDYVIPDSVSISLAPDGGLVVEDVGSSNPAFSAIINTNQTGVVTNTFTKVTLDGVILDTHGYFSNSRFTPLVGGWYYFTGGISFRGVSDQKRIYVILYKNGLYYKLFTQITTSTASTVIASAGAGGLVWMNGSSDYVELYAFHDNGSDIILDGLSGNSGNTIYTFFDGMRVFI